MYLVATPAGGDVGLGKGLLVLPQPVQSSQVSQGSSTFVSVGTPGRGLWGPAEDGFPRVTVTSLCVEAPEWGADSCETGVGGAIT